MSHVLNDVNHFVTDDDGIFVINPANKEITYTQNGETVYYDLPVLVQGDCNSERLTFKIPKTIEGHDMSDCNLIRIHYIAFDSKTSSQYNDAYDVPTYDIDTTTDPDHLQFTWLIDQNVTQTVGPISFAIQFACVVSTTQTTTTVDPETDEEITSTATVVNTLYSWSTKPYTELSITDGINNTKQAAEDFEDRYNLIVITWHNEIEAAIARSDASNIKSIDQTITSPDDSGINVVTVTYGDDTTSTFTVKNGSKGSAGLSAYQVAYANAVSKGEDIGNEEDWLDSLKAEGYEDCLKGVTLTQAEYDSLSEAEKNREDFVYIIKNETLHADSATTAAGYTQDGEIAAKFSTIESALGNKAGADHTHDEYLASDHTHDEYATSNIFSETSSVLIPYTCYTASSGSTAILDPIITYLGNDDGDDTVSHDFKITNINDFEVTCVWSAGDFTDGGTETIPANSSTTLYAGSSSNTCWVRAQFSYNDSRSRIISCELGSDDEPSYLFEIIPTPVSYTIDDDLIYTHAEITSCSLTGDVDYKVEVSSDGKQLIFTLSGYIATYEGGEQIATLEYTYNAYRPAYRSQWADKADKLTLRSAMYTFDGSNPVSVTVSPNRAYIVSMHIEDVTYVPRSYTGVIYIPEDGVPTNNGEVSRAYSSVMGLEHVQPYQLMITRNGNTGKYSAVILKPDVDSVMAADVYVACTFTLIEL